MHRQVDHCHDAEVQHGLDVASIDCGSDPEKICNYGSHGALQNQDGGPASIHKCFLDSGGKYGHENTGVTMPAAQN